MALNSLKNIYQKPKLKIAIFSLKAVLKTLFPELVTWYERDTTRTLVRRLFLDVRRELGMPCHVTKSHVLLQGNKDLSSTLVELPYGGGGAAAWISCCIPTDSSSREQLTSRVLHFIRAAYNRITWPIFTVGKMF